MTPPSPQTLSPFVEPFNQIEQAFVARLSMTWMADAPVCDIYPAGSIWHQYGMVKRMVTVHDE